MEINEGAARKEKVLNILSYCWESVKLTFPSGAPGVLEGVFCVSPGGGTLEGQGRVQAERVAGRGHMPL